MKRISWTNQEMKQVAHEYHEQRAKGASKRDAIRKAQKCLPKDRQRALNSSGNISVACQQLDHRRKANGQRPKVRVVRGTVKTIPAFFAAIETLPLYQVRELYKALHKIFGE